MNKPERDNGETTVRVALVDAGYGNLVSITNALSTFPVDVVIVDDGVGFPEVDRIVLPGVRHFDTGMQGLRARMLEEPLTKRVVDQKIPFLGICLGMQVMFESSAEGNEKGLGWFAGELSAFSVSSGAPRSIHMGWSTAQFEPECRLFDELDPSADFYFLHEFYLPKDQGFEHAVAWAEFGISFVSGIANGDMYGVQFHPEKSQLAGLKVLENFLSPVKVGLP